MHTADEFLAGLRKQQRQIDEMVARAEKAVRKQRYSAQDGDRITYSFVGSVDFPQQNDTAQDVIFTVPEQQDFFAERLAFFPFFRYETTDEANNGPSEVSYRPCVFTSYEGVFNPRIQTDAAAVDCSIALSETFYNEKGQQISRAMQNMPTPVELFRSGAVNYRRGGRTGLGGVQDPQIDPYYAGFEFPTAMLFSIPWFLPGGTSVTVKIAPNFAGVREDPVLTNADQTNLNAYRVTAVLSGYKRIK
jgi:hypothetical protein